MLVLLCGVMAFISLISLLTGGAQWLGFFTLLLSVTLLCCMTFFEKSIPERIMSIAAPGMLVVLLVLSLTVPPTTIVFAYQDNEREASIKHIEQMIVNEEFDDAKLAIEQFRLGDGNSDTYNILQAMYTLASETDRYEQAYAKRYLDYVKVKTPTYYRLMIETMYVTPVGSARFPYQMLGIVQEAAMAYPYDAEFQQLAGVFSYHNDLYETALYFLTRALELEPENPYSLYYYALSTYLVGNVEEGKAYLAQAKLFAGDDADLRTSIGTYQQYMQEGVR